VFFPGLDQAPEESSLLFYDLETTGLSGGAGTTAFLAGVGELVPGAFKLTQIFLADYPGEPEFLARLQELLPSSRIWVSYNGRAFDTNLLKTRFLLNGLPFSPGPQLDLLYPARRLFKSLLPDCSLTTLERRVLRKPRGRDIPGAFIPARYFYYLSSGRAEELSDVFTHHCRDILSLAELYGHIPALLADPSSGVLSGEYDPLGAAGWLMGHRNHPRLFALGLEHLRQAYLRQVPGAGLKLARFYARRAEGDRAFRIWQELFQQGRDYASGLALAKDLEHRQKDDSAALGVTEELLSLFGGTRGLPELLKRQARLKARLSRPGPPG
jgi:hypothetical protein